ncbi:MAG TPA: nucleotide exchange factor GrpE [Bacillota bacterium]|nr:nucleotide exchange factor GrpE [Bacillota bacterium]
MKQKEKEIREEDIEVLDQAADEADDQGEQVDEETVSQEEFQALKEEKDELYERMLRVQAEYDNYKRRTQKERTSDLKYKSQDLATELLPALDNFERALQVEETEETKGIIEGITMVYNQLIEALKSQGVDVIETENEPFDPNLHHAVMQDENENIESNIVVEELQKGYILKDRVIRPAMVKVNK